MRHKSYYDRKDKNDVCVLRQITINMTAKFIGVHQSVFYFPLTMQAHIVEIVVKLLVCYCLVYLQNIIN